MAMKMTMRSHGHFGFEGSDFLGSSLGGSLGSLNSLQVSQNHFCASSLSTIGMPHLLHTGRGYDLSVR